MSKIIVLQITFMINKVSWQHFQLCFYQGSLSGVCNMPGNRLTAVCLGRESLRRQHFLNLNNCKLQEFKNFS